MSKDLPPEQAARVIAMADQLLRQGRYASKADLARALGISGPAISQWYTGKNSPSYRVAVKVAHIAGITVQELLGPPLPTLHPTSNQRPKK